MSKAKSTRRVEANEALEVTKKELEAEITSKQNQLAQRLRKKVSEGEAKINQSKAETLDKVRDISAELAAEIVKKIGVSGVANENIRKVIR